MADRRAPWGRTRWPVLACLASLALAACATEEPGITPERNRFYFPSVLALDPEWPVLYVGNANADLKFNGGTVNVLQIGKLPLDLTRVGEWVRTGDPQTRVKLDCHQDPFDPTVWECPEEQFIDPASTVRIGDYPGAMRVTPGKLGDQTRDRRLFVPVRGQNLLLWVDVARFTDAQKQVHYDLRCTTSSSGGCARGSAVDCEVWDCDESHQVNYSQETRKQLPAEPFSLEINPLVAVHVDEDGVRRTCRDEGLPAVSCDCGGLRACDLKLEAGDRGCCEPPPRVGTDHLYVTHILNGEVSFFTSEPDTVRLRDVRGNFFTPTSGLSGAFAMATQRPGDPRSLTYVSSRVDVNLASFVIRENSRIIDATRAPITAISPGADARGLAFSPAGGQLYVINRQPSSLLAMDMVPPSPGDLPAQTPVWVAEVCDEPSVLRLGPDPQKPTEPLARLAYVVCFGAGQIFLVDTALGRVVDLILTGRGPNELVIDGANRRAFVANFLDNTIGVIDLDPSHPSYNRMVLRIGHNESLLRTE